MTIPFEKLKARLLANPKVKVEYDALAPEFEISAELVKARLRARAPRHCCATPRQPAAGSTCGYQRPDASYVRVPDSVRPHPHFHASNYLRLAIST